MNRQPLPMHRPNRPFVGWEVVRLGGPHGQWFRLYIDGIAMAGGPLNHVATVLNNYAEAA